MADDDNSDADARAKRALAIRLRFAREHVGLSQGAVARSFGMHRPTISMIEAGRRNVSALELERFAKLYGTTVAALHDDPDEPPHYHGWVGQVEVGGEQITYSAHASSDPKTIALMEELVRAAVAHMHAQAQRAGEEGKDDGDER